MQRFFIPETGTVHGGWNGPTAVSFSEAAISQLELQGSPTTWYLTAIFGLQMHLSECA